MRIIWIYSCVINLITFLMYGADKWKAVHKRWRIPEAVLIVTACAGGSVGGLLGMYAFHHKTRKPAFRFGLPAVLVLQILLLICVKRAGIVS